MMAALFLVLTANLCAQETPLPEISPSPVRVDQRFTLTFEIRHHSAEDVQVPFDVRFPQSIQLIGGPGIYPVTEKDSRTGMLERLVKVQYVFRAVKAGRSILDSIPFTIAGVPGSTRPRILEIAYRQGPPLVPFDLAWRIQPSGPLYEGQTAAVFLEMRNLRAITVPESFTVSPPGGALFETAKGLGTIQSQRVGKEELFRIPVVSYLVTPSSQGRIVIPEAKVKAKELTVSSDSLAVEVLSVPDAVRPTGAVGRFHVTSWLEKESIPLGSQVRLSFRVEGEGNLNYFQLPDPSSDDVTVVGKTSRPSFVPTEKGYRGFIQWDYRLSPKRIGDLSIRVPAFPWLEPETGEVSSSLPKTLTLRVGERREGVQPGESKLRILGSDEVFRYDPMDAYKKPLVYALGMPGILCLVLVVFRRRKEAGAALLASMLLLGASSGTETDRARSIDEGVAAYNAGKYGEAVERFSSLPKSAGVHYDLGVAHKAAGNVARSVFHLRKAVEASPGAAVFRDALAAVESEYGLLRQVPLPRLHPDIFLWFFLVFFTGAGVFPLVLRKRGLRFILSVLCITVAGSTLFGLVVSASERDAGRGVIGPKSVELRKIPLPSSSEWLFLEEGTAVEVEGVSGDYLLVKTAFGVEGWVEKSRLITE